MEVNLNNSLVLQNYKEPLKPIPKKLGFGYYGAVMVTQDGAEIQCHSCGETFSHLGTHIWQAHEMNAREYKEKFGLARETALVSEKQRQALKEQTLEWLRKMTPAQIKAMRERQKQGYLSWKKKNKNYRFKIRLETKNKRGTCPDQLIAKIVECEKELGHSPSKDDFITYCGSQRYVHLIYTTFGSWTEAVKRAGLQLKEHKTNKGILKNNYSDDELLDFLSIYWKENGVVPTSTDARRGMIPHLEIYTRRFGSIGKARELAGITEEPQGRWGNS